MNNWIIIYPDGTQNLVTSEDEPGPDSGYEGVQVLPADSNVDLSIGSINLTTGEWEENLEPLKARMMLKINQEREKYSQNLLTEGTAKTLAYAHKAAEIDRYDAGAREGLPFAEAHAEQNSVSLADAIESFRIGRAASTNSLALIEAKAQAAIAEVVSATSAADIYEAAQVDW